MKTRSVVMSTVATLAIFASTVVAAGNAQPLSHLLHLHPGSSNAQADERVALHLYNDSTLFKDVMVAGKTYTLGAHQFLAIKAPVGTPVYAEANVSMHRRGDVFLTVAPEMSGQLINMR